MQVKNQVALFTFNSLPRAQLPMRNDMKRPRDKDPRAVRSFLILDLLE